MTTHFVCPHCGQRTSTERDDVEWVDLDNGTDDCLFPVLKDPLQERHINQRLCCQKCYEVAGATTSKLGIPHPFAVETHDLEMARVQENFDLAHPTDVAVQLRAQVRALTARKR